MGQILHLIRDLLWILCGIRDQTFGVRDQIFGYKKWDIIDGIIYKIYKTVYLQNYTIYKTGSRAVLLSSAKQYMYLLFSLKRCIIKQLLDPLFAMSVFIITVLLATRLIYILH